MSLPFRGDTGLTDCGNGSKKSEKVFNDYKPTQTRNRRVLSRTFAHKKTLSFNQIMSINYVRAVLKLVFADWYRDFRQ